MDNNAIMKPAEVAEYLRIPLRTLYKLCNEGHVPATRVGKHWRFRKSEIDRWFDGNNVGMGEDLAPANAMGSGES